MNYTVAILSVLFSILIFSGCNPAKEEAYISPTVISGQVKDEQGIIVPNAKITLPTAVDFTSVFTDQQGLFYLTNFPAVKHRLKIEKIGFEVYEADVPKPINGVSTMSPILKRKTYTLSAVKPMSTFASAVICSVTGKPSHTTRKNPASPAPHTAPRLFVE